MNRVVCAFLLFGLTAFLLASPATAVTTVIDTTIYTQGGERSYHLEIASTPEAREIGLMNRDSVAPEDGMIFVFPTVGNYKFWMKNTRIPLDMIFVDDTQSIVAIAAKTSPNTLNFHSAGKPVKAVIELDGGRAAADGIAVGDKVRYELPKGITVE